MTCPTCGCDTVVIDSRPIPHGIWRRRECLGKDRHRFSTDERHTKLPAPRRAS